MYLQYGGHWEGPRIQETQALSSWSAPIHGDGAHQIRPQISGWNGMGIPDKGLEELDSGEVTAG